MNTFKILSVNCNGIADDVKRRDVFDKLRQLDCNLYLLQETHLKESQELFIRAGWGFQVILAGNSSNAGGTAILFKNNFEFSISRVEKDQNGHYIILEINHMNKVFTVVNIYGPSAGDDEDFFVKLNRTLDDFDQGNFIIGGDFNCVLDPNLDRKNCVSSSSRPRSRLKIIEMMGNLNLVDIFRSLHPDKKSYTWRRFNSNQQARLDYFLVSEDLVQEVKEISSSCKYRSDHTPIIIDINRNAFKREKTFWKFNNRLLYDKDYISLVKEEIKRTKQQYCVLVYDINSVDKIQPADLALQIDDDLFLETVLMNIRGKTIAYSSKKKKEENLKEQELEKRIVELENNFVNDNIEEINRLKLELESIREIKTQGIIVRSKANWLNQGEKVTKYFFNLENRNFKEKMIVNVEKQNGTILTTQQDIKNEVREFYKNLYAGRNVIDCNLENLKNKAVILTEEEKNQTEGELTLEEIEYAIKNLSNNKSPGPDGFTAEFFKCFREELSTFILRSANCGFAKGKLSISMRQGSIVLIPKENKPKRFIKNLRPISLLSTTYKIISTCIANRMKEVLPQIIGKSQNAFIRGRNINMTYRFVYDTLVYTEENNIPGMLLSIDFEKAFDSISWSFMQKALEFFNFGPIFRGWIRTLYSDISSCISINGQYTEWFDIQRGVRQGDPSSAYLYLVCAEILSLLIKDNNKIKGIKMKNNINLLSQFADDTTLSLDGSEDSLKEAMNTISDFSRISGLQINEEKTMIIWVGSNKGSKTRYLRDRNYVWDPGLSFKICGIKFSTDIQTIPHLNYNDKILEIRKTIHKWKKRKITPFGKILIIKSLIISKITHLFFNIPDPSEDFFKECEKEL